MFGRIFGRGKDDQDQAVCAECGRTLLAGEWTRTIVDERGDERLICSLCGQAYSGGSEPVAAAPTPANQGRVRETRSETRYEPEAARQAAPDPADDPPAPGERAESDAFWQALKDKDAHIEDLKAQLARAEAERQELAGRFARLGAGAAAGSAAASAEEAAPEPGSLTGDSSEPGERTWGETPAEFAAELEALRQATPEAEQLGEAWDEPATPATEPALGAPEAIGAESPETVGLEVEAEVTGDFTAAASDAEAAGEGPSAGEPPVFRAPAYEPLADVSPIIFEDTQPIEGLSDELVEDEEGDAGTGRIAAAEVAAAGGLPGEQPVEPVVVSPAEAEAAAASLTLLQRGVDLLNVSRVPHKIAETNEQLGLPHVHVGFDGQTVAVTFMWTMGWYQFHVDLESGNVSMNDRGYEARSDLPPNAGVRADGTVQLAPAQISRAAAQRAQTPPEQLARPAPAGPTSEPATPREAAQKPPEFLSKSLLGQRSDDEASSWEQTKARDFDWER